MSATQLRAAASLLRKRAEAAMEDNAEQPWIAGPTIDPENMGWYVASDIPEADWDTTVAHLPYDYDGKVAAHIAALHPAVALALADWLDSEARDRTGSIHERAIPSAALALARTYLGEQS